VFVFYQTSFLTGATLRLYYTCWVQVCNENDAACNEVSCAFNIDRTDCPKAVELRLNTSSHVLRALKWTTFCQGMQLKKYGHFGTGTSHQNPRFNQNV